MLSTCSYNFKILQGGVLPEVLISNALYLLEFPLKSDIFFLIGAEVSGGDAELEMNIKADAVPENMK